MMNNTFCPDCAALHRLLKQQSEAALKLKVWWDKTQAIIPAEEAHDVANLIGVLAGNAELYSLRSRSTSEQ